MIAAGFRNPAQNGLAQAGCARNKMAATHPAAVIAAADAHTKRKGWTIRRCSSFRRRASPRAASGRHWDETVRDASRSSTQRLTLSLLSIYSEVLLSKRLLGTA